MLSNWASDCGLDEPRLSLGESRRGAEGRHNNVSLESEKLEKVGAVSSHEYCFLCLLPEGQQTATFLLTSSGMVGQHMPK